MKANHHAHELLQEQRAQVGIGAMIVFIASVLVAAIAAAVLLDVSGTLQERSSRTGMEATQQVSSNLDVVSKKGERTTTGISDPLTSLLIQVKLSPGASQLDLSQLIIEVSDGNTLSHLNYTDGAAGEGNFNASALRDADSSFSNVTPVMTAGDLAQIRIDMNANNMPIKTRQLLELDLVPEVGVRVNSDIRSPSSFGSDKVVSLS